MDKAKRNGRRKGQGLTEYIIIVALVAIAAIGVVNIFGQQVREQFRAIVAAMAGSNTQVTSYADKAEKEAGTKSLADYAKTPGKQ